MNILIEIEDGQRWNVRRQQTYIKKRWLILLDVAANQL